MKKTTSLLLPICGILLITSCKKETLDSENYRKSMAAPDYEMGHLLQTKTYSTEVLQKWIDFDLRLLRTNGSLLNNFVMLRHWAYSSIALYEGVVPGMPAYQSLSGQLTEMPVMPAIQPGQAYHWPTVANTVLASMKRYYYPAIPEADKVSTDSLENALNEAYQQEVGSGIFQASVAFGKAVSEAVYGWSLSDGSFGVYPAYVLPVGPGQWEKTPPGYLNPQIPYWSTNRQLIPGSLEAAHIDGPPAFSTDPGSEFYAAAKEVYDLSLVLTDAQKEQVLAWRDVPGGGHAHWMDILNQVLKAEGDAVMLDKAALVYARLGISQSDARIATWKAKYDYNHIRPITYIRSAMGYATWNSFITTPNHPEYPSAHSSFSVPAAIVMGQAFGDDYSFTDHTNDFLGMPPRYYESFDQAAWDAGESRVAGGLHYRFSIAAGSQLGTAIINHMDQQVRFNR